MLTFHPESPDASRKRTTALVHGYITICETFYLPPKPMDMCKLVQEGTKDHPYQRLSRGRHIPHTCLGNGDNVVCPFGVVHEGIGTCKVKAFLFGPPWRIPFCLWV